MKLDTLVIIFILVFFYFIFSNDTLLSISPFSHLQAEAELKKGGGLFGGLFGGGTERFENAAEKFQRAGHAYKASKNWAGAAATYVKAADAFKKAKSDGDVANCYIEGARCYIKAGDSKTATDLIENEALPRMVDAGRLSQAAKLHEEVAGMLEEADSEFEIYESILVLEPHAFSIFSFNNS